MDSQEHIKLWVSEFLKKHFKSIDLVKCQWNVTNLKQALKEVETKDFIPGWIIGEVMKWGMKDKLDWTKKENIFINYDDFFVVELGERYFRFNHKDHHMMIEVFPKIKTVVSFEDHK